MKEWWWAWSSVIWTMLIPYCMVYWTVQEKTPVSTKMAAKLVLNRSKNSSSTALRSLHWLPIWQRIKFKILTLDYNSLKGKAPVYLKNLLVPLLSARNVHSSSDTTRSLIPKDQSKTVCRQKFQCRRTSTLEPVTKGICESNSFEIF